MNPIMTRIMQVALGVLTVLLILVSIAAWSRGKDIDTLKTTVTSLTVERDKLKAAKDFTEQAENINQNVGVIIATGVRDKNNAFGNVFTSSQEELAAIELKYQDIPVTDETVKAKSTEISKVRVDSMWAAYCLALPSSPDCQPKP